MQSLENTCESVSNNKAKSFGGKLYVMLQCTILFCNSVVNARTCGQNASSMIANICQEFVYQEEEICMQTVCFKLFGRVDIYRYFAW